MRDVGEITISAMACMGVLGSNPILISGTPKAAQQRLRASPTFRLLVAFALSYVITRDPVEATIAVVLFLFARHAARRYYSRNHA